METFKYYENKHVALAMKILLLLSVLSLFSCKKYLDLKPDASLYIASNLKDCQALLDDYSVMNGQYPIDGEASSDNYYLTDEGWASLYTVESQETYIWSPQAQHLIQQWANPYSTVFNANLVLQILEKIEPSSGADYNAIKGSALFFRGYALYSVASLFCKPYDPQTSGQDPGIPLHLSADVKEDPGRGTVQQTYDRIIQDLMQAIELLPEKSIVKSRPNKAAALATLARVYLSMRDYIKAGTYADECLKKHNYLLNYNLLTTSVPLPFIRFNDEVIFQATMPVSNPALLQSNALILKTLYDSYEPNDIRKEAFFKENIGDTENTYAFKGSYDGSMVPFSGLATDEVYLIRAECNARNGKTAEALKDLNDLLITRWKYQRDADGNIVKDANGNNVSTYVPYTASNAEEAIAIILAERRKELLMRGIRWTDLRRLNKEPGRELTLTRTLNGTTYTLPPNDLRYVLLIPRDVTNNSSVTQNPR